MAVWRNTIYAEAIPESPEESLGRDNSRTQRAIYVAWDQRYQAVRDFVGWPELKADGATPFISRTTPHRHPEAQFMVCTGCTRIQGMVPRGKTTGPNPGQDLAKYDLAKLYLSYETVLYDIKEDAESLGLGGFPDDGQTFRYVATLFQPAGKFTTIPRGQLRKVDAAAPARVLITHEHAKFIPEGELTMNWVDVPTIPIQAILNTAGKVNSAAFNGFPAETLLCLPPRIRPTTSPAPTPTGGVRTWDILYQFKWLPSVDKGGAARGHNWLLRYDAGAIDYVEVSSDGTPAGDRIYRTADFRKLFRPDQP